MRGDPADGSLITTADDPAAYLYGCDGVGLTRAKSIRAYPLDGCGRVREEGVLAVVLLAAVEDAECLIDGKDRWEWRAWWRAW